MKNLIALDKKKRWEIVSIFILFFIVSYLPVSFLSKMFYFMGLLWPYCLSEETVEDKINTRKYRFSFFRAAFSFQKLLYSFTDGRLDRFKKYTSMVVRATSPFALTVIFFLIAADGNPVMTIFGSASFEILGLLLAKT